MARVTYIEEGTTDDPTVQAAFDARLKERIILRVSILNRSGYCTHAHEQISEITMVAALYNMVNRFNEALKLDREAY